MNLTKTYETFMLLLVAVKSTLTTLPNNKKNCKLKCYLNLMTILKSLKSCINLYLTSSETQLNLYSLCKSYCN